MRIGAWGHLCSTFYMVVLMRVPGGTHRVRTFHLAVFMGVQVLTTITGSLTAHAGMLGTVLDLELLLV